MTTLIAGATGYLGSLISRGLLQQGNAVSILVRPTSNYKGLVEGGATAVLGDLKDPESLREACNGVDVVVTTANSAQRGGADTPESVDLIGNRNLIDAACEAGVQQYIFVSALGAELSSVPFLQAKAKTEEYLRTSGLTYTILASHIFMDVWIPIVIGSAVQEGRSVLLLGAGERKHSFIAASDVAAFAIASVTHKAAFNQKLMLGGPDAISWRDLVLMTEGVLGKEIAVQTLTPGEGPPLPELIVGLLLGMEAGDVVIPMAATAKTFGVKQTTPETYIRHLFTHN